MKIPKTILKLMYLMIVASVLLPFSPARALNAVDFGANSEYFAIDGKYYVDPRMTDSWQPSQLAFFLQNSSFSRMTKPQVDAFLGVTSSPNADNLTNALGPPTTLQGEVYRWQAIIDDDICCGTDRIEVITQAIPTIDPTVIANISAKADDGSRPGYWLVSAERPLQRLDSYNIPEVGVVPNAGAIFIPSVGVDKVVISGCNSGVGVRVEMIVYEASGKRAYYNETFVPNSDARPVFIFP